MNVKKTQINLRWVLSVLPVRFTIAIIVLSITSSYPTSINSRFIC